MACEPGLCRRSLDLFAQTRLADPGLAAEIYGLAAPGFTAGHQRCLYLVKFRAPADKRPLLVRSRSQAEETPCPDWLGKAFDGECACLGAIEPLGERAVCLIRHEDFAGRGGVSEPRCEVCRIAGHSVFAVARTASAA